MEHLKREMLYLIIAIILILVFVKVTAVDLAKYPEFFEKDGNYDLFIVAGEKADKSDVQGVLKIANSLKIPKTKKEENKTARKEFAEFGSMTDQVEIKESLGDVRQSFSGRDITGLESGEVMTDKGRTKYNQFLKFSDSSGSIKSGNVSLFDDDQNHVEVMLKFEEGKDIFEYELQFEDGLKSEITAGKLNDLVDKTLNILGKEYTIVSADVDTSAKVLSLELLSGGIKGILDEGEKKSYFVEGKEYTVEVVTISDKGETVILKVNDELLSKMSVGSITKLKDGMFIGIKSIVIDEFGETSDLIEFYLGTRKIYLRDKYNDDTFNELVEVNGEGILGGKVQIKGDETSAGDFKIFGMKYRLETEGIKRDAYLIEGHSLKEYLKQIQGLLGINILFDGPIPVKESAVNLIASGSNSYVLEFSNNAGQSFIIPFIDNSATFKLGNEKYGFHFIEEDLTNNGGTAQESDFDIQEGDYFVISDSNGANDDKNAITVVMRYSSLSNDTKTLTFDDVSGGVYKTTYEAGQFGFGSEVSGKATITRGGSFIVYIGTNGNLAIDLNGDGSINGNEVRITTQYGGVIDIGSTESPSGDFDITLRTLSSDFEEGRSIETGGDHVATITIEGSGNDVDLSLGSGFIIEDHATITDAKKVITAYGVEGYLKDSSDEASDLYLNYPSKQKTYKVITTVSDEYTPEKKVEELSMIKQAMFDSEFSGINKDMILIGGPCANTVTAQVLERSIEECAEGFKPGEAIIKLLRKDGHNILIVAGYNAEDTMKAVNVLVEHDSYSLKSDEVRITGDIIAPIVDVRF